MTVAPTRAPAASSNAIPLLQNGDRLTRAEFERRYRAMPHVNKAELIEGTVYMPSPVRLTKHGQPHSLLVTWLGYYLSKTPGLIIGDNATSRLDEDNEPQPDAMLLLPRAAGGQAQIDADDYVSGPPELVAEVAASSVSIDLHAKLNAYRRNGVKEYVVWRVEDGAIDWFVLQDGRFDPLPVADRGWLHSRVFPGLWLDVQSLLSGDLARAFAAVDAGVATPEHRAFAARVGAAASG